MLGSFGSSSSFRRATQPEGQSQAGEHLQKNPTVARRSGALSRGNGPTPGAGRGKAGQGGGAAPPPAQLHPSLCQTFLGLRTRCSGCWKGGAPPPPAVPSTAPRARPETGTWSPRCSGPEGMRHPQGPRLPGSAARASVSGEWSARYREGSRGRSRPGRAWGGRHAGASAGLSFSGLPDI